MEPLQRFNHTIDGLRNVVNLYMKNDIDGANFHKEIDFENAVRKKLLAAGFEVLEKKNVENIQSIIEKGYSKTDRQIPDISVKCSDGLVLMELKNDDGPSLYCGDVDKVDTYLEKEKCDAVGCLFLDHQQREGWEQCRKNKEYYYFWKLEKE